MTNKEIEDIKKAIDNGYITRCGICKSFQVMKEAVDCTCGCGGYTRSECQDCGATKAWGEWCAKEGAR